MLTRRKELEQLRTELAVAQASLKYASDAWVNWKAMQAGTKAELDRTNIELAHKTNEVHDLDKKVAVLTERLDLVVNHGLGEPSRLTGPTSMPEEAEDALFAFRAGHIDKSSLEQALAQSGYDHTEIEFELSEYPRHAVQ